MSEILCAVGYVFFGGVSLGVYREFLVEEYSGPDIIFIPLFWPIILPAFVGYFAIGLIFGRKS